MSYEANEESVQGGFAVELFTFEGTFNNHYLTSYAEDYTFNGQVYTSTPGLQRKNTDSTAVGGSSSGALEIDLPFSVAVAREYAFSDVPPELTFTLHRGHASDVDAAFRILWTGKGGVWTVKGRMASLQIPSAFSAALGTSFPARRWQSPCNHLLYDARCGINRADYDHSTTITSITGSRIRVATLPWTVKEGVGGEVVNNSTGERRTIRSHDGDVVRLKLPFAYAEPGQSITLYQGCDHTAVTCRDKFNNLDEYGGFNLIPSKNPFGGTLR
jgi:uncharacterized phage protein (TIGR02218 family)